MCRFHKRHPVVFFLFVFNVDLYELVCKNRSKRPFASAHFALIDDELNRIQHVIIVTMCYLSVENCELLCVQSSGSAAKTAKLNRMLDSYCILFKEINHMIG